MNSNTYRCCYSEVEKDILYLLYCKNHNFVKFREEIINALKLQVIELFKEDILLLCLLEGMLDEDYLNLLDALIKVTKDLHRFRLRYIEHRFI